MLPILPTSSRKYRVTVSLLSAARFYYSVEMSYWTGKEGGRQGRQGRKDEERKETGVATCLYPSPSFPPRKKTWHAVEWPKH